MKIKRFALRLLILLLLFIAAFFFLMTAEINKLEKQDFAALHVADLPDGTYQGSASALAVTAKVEVIVSGGQIQEVKLLSHQHGPGYGADAICEKIVQANGLDVDSISGATASSIVVKSAVLEALKSGVAP